MKKAYKLIISIILPFLAAGIGSIFTSKTVSTWYETLQRPSFSPPNWVFGPVWTILYLLMGFSLYLVWKKGITRIAGIFFGTQLALNALWSILFFGMQQPLWAFADIIFLWAAILGTIITFYRIDKRAAYLLIPYFLWVSFAAVLNYYIVILNL